MSRLPAVLRASLLALLAALLLAPGLAAPRAGQGRVLRIHTPAELRDADSLLVGAPPAAVAWEGNEAPGAAELETLAAAAQRAPLFVTAPARTRLVDASLSAHPRAGRAAAVSARVSGRAGERVRLWLLEGGAPVDSLKLVLPREGEARAGFRVRPAVAGWHAWEVRAQWPGGNETTASTGAWVDSGGAPRVLVRAGFPDWESKFVTRALEESGAPVVESLALGRGLGVAAGAGGGIDAARLTRVDVVLVLDGAPLSPGESAALADWAQRGGGVLLAGDRAAAGGFGLVRGAGRAADVDGSAIRWQLPPELAPLPVERVRGAAQPFAALAPGAWAGAAGPAGTVLALRPMGRGRAAALALSESWRWRMEAGRVAEHREFWRSLVDWLASAGADSLLIQAPGGPVSAGTPVPIQVYDSRSADAPAPAVRVTRPGGGEDALALARDPAEPGVWSGWLTPERPGIYRLGFTGPGPSAALQTANRPEPAAGGWASVAALADASGGGMLPAAEARAALARRTAGGDGGWPPPGPALILALLVALAAAEWAIRRLGGRA